MHPLRRSGEPSVALPALASLVCLLACSGAPGASPTAATTAPSVERVGAPRATAAVPLTDAAAEDTLARVIAETRLTTLPRECYAFEPDDSARYRYSVREVHNRRCGGDPNTAPRMFDVRLDPATGAVLSDNGPMLRGGDDGQDGAGMDTVRRARARRSQPRP